MVKPVVKGRLVLFVVYVIAFSLAFWAGSASAYSILVKSVIMVLLAVVIIFLGSVDFNNSSIFDPYWSVAPPLMIVFYFWMMLLEQPIDAGQWSMMTNTWSPETISPAGPDIANGSMAKPAAEPLAYFPRLILLSLLTLAYSIRLTWNFLRGWPGLKHEDWRYVAFRKQSGKAYWLVSFSAIHLFPAAMVFAGTLSIYVTIVYGYRPLNIFDVLAFLVIAFALILETVSDNQMRCYLKEHKGEDGIMDQGLWGRCRHPNYLGEMGYWWGLWLFAMAANPSFWWVVAGPLAISFMFLFASIPMLEKRLIAKRPGYREYQKRVPMLLPWKVR